MENRPRGRQKNVAGEGKGVHKGESVGGGPLSSGRRPTGSGGSAGGPGRESGGNRSGGGGRLPLPLLLILVVVFLFGGRIFGGNDSGESPKPGNQSSSNQSSGQSSNQSASFPLSQIFGQNIFQNGNAGYSTGWVEPANEGTLDQTVEEGSRAKYTSIKGNGQDTVTFMVYMCGTDLESRSGMATNDLLEMANAKLSDKINIIVYTGGCSRWNNQVVSSKVNQVYQVKNGGLVPLVKDAGTGAMTNPSTLASFIQFCKKNFPADRNELILWDHGGGSVSGYGYDEKNRTAGSMPLSGIRTALQQGGVKFDFVGYDACLMATVENALMLNDYADYLIASEETEPGIGWFYTDWLNALSKNTSMPTLELGQRIIDSFVAKCNEKCRGQATTLSIVDLAELANTVPQKLKDFSSSTSSLIENQKYAQVSSARNQTREFASSTKIDQIDLTHFARNLKTKEGDALAEAIKGAVKYNKTSANMTNAYGLSIYFPYRKASSVDSAVKTYAVIGMDEEYSRCIQAFAKMQYSGAAVSGGSPSPFSTLSGQPATNVNPQDMISILGSILGGDLGGLSQSLLGVGSGNSGFLTGRSISDDVVKDYVTHNQIDVEQLVWTEENGQKLLKLTEEQWAEIYGIVQSKYYDDGEGYVELGTDNVFEFDDDGNLIGSTESDWVSINSQPVAYYFDSMDDDGENYVIRGHVPAYLNGNKVNLNIIFDTENPDGYIDGATAVYEENESETVAKNIVELKKGDKLQFICSYYDYDDNFVSNYKLGEEMTVTDKMEIRNTIVKGGKMEICYCLTDQYNRQHWTPVILGTE